MSIHQLQLLYKLQQIQAKTQATLFPKESNNLKKNNRNVRKCRQ